jgi:glycosidase
MMALCLLSSTARSAPEDWRDLFIYQIMTDRFADGDPSNNNAQGAYYPNYGTGVHGGDFAGIEEHLAYIKGLGANAIWISPVALNAYGRYHGYHTQDFHTISPQAGGIEALRSLVAAAHAESMVVIADVVVNHLADLSTSRAPEWPTYRNPSDYTLEWKSEAVRPAPPFDRLDWLHNYGWIGNYQDPEQLLGELQGLDDLRTEAAAVRAALVDAHAWLIEELGIDAFRIDTVKHVELGFWQTWPAAIRDRAREAGKSDFFIFGEVLDGSDSKCGLYTGSRAGGPYALDSVLAYPLYFTLNEVFIQGKSTKLINDRWNALGAYDPAAQERLVTFLDNHDQPRFLSLEQGAGDIDRLRTALGFLLSSRGIPTVYYGTEAGFDGGDDPSNREDLFDGAYEWGPSLGDNFDPAAPIYRWLRLLASVRQKHPSLRRGETTTLAQSFSGRGILAFQRASGDETLIVLLNTASEPISSGLLPTPFGSRVPIFDLAGAGSLIDTTDSAGNLSPSVPGNGFLILSTAPDPDRSPWLVASHPDHDRPTLTATDPLEWVFDRAMEPESVHSNLTITPEVAGGFHWLAPNHLRFTPASAWTPGAEYRVRIGAAARAAHGDQQAIGVDIELLFRGGTSGYQPPDPVTVTAPLVATDLITASLTAPRALITRGPWNDGEILIADDSQILRFTASGEFIGALAANPSLVAVSALAWDRTGHFGAGLLAATPSGILQIDSTGTIAEGVRFPSAPIGEPPLAADHTGTIYTAAPEADMVWSLTPEGVRELVPNLRAPRGLTQSGGGFAGLLLIADASMAADYDAWDGRGRILTADADGGLTAVTGVRPELAGVGALLLDLDDAFEGDLFAADVVHESILSIDPTGAIEEFASGFGNLAAAGCLAQATDGALLVLDCGRSNRATAARHLAPPPRVVRIAPKETGIELPVESTSPHPVTLSPIAPNPMNPRTQIQFRLERTARVRVSIYSIQGARIRVLLDSELAAGDHLLAWDGRDSTQRMVASGVYLLQLEAAGVRHRQRIVVLK